MKRATLNVTRINNRIKVKKVKAWLQQHGVIDVVALSEVKVSGQKLKKKLQEVDNNLIWLYSFMSKDQEELH